MEKTLMVLNPQLRDYLIRLLQEEQERERAALPSNCVYSELRSTRALQAIQSASLIRLPEIHEFIDQDGERWQAVGWSQEDAKERIRMDGRAHGELQWAASGIAWPGLWECRLANFFPEE